VFHSMNSLLFFFNVLLTTYIYTLSLHDALPIYYLAAAFPELNAWERAGADASSAGMVDAGFENQKELTKMQLDNQKEIASAPAQIGRAVQQECRDRSRMPSSA